MDSHRGWHESAVFDAAQHEATGIAATAGVPAAVGIAAAAQSLAGLHKGARGTVSAVVDHGLAGDAAGVTIGDSAGSTIARRLIELGFVAGERVEIIEEVRPGGDPIAVRIGASIFALRRREAQAVLVRVEAVEAA